ncbi:Hypothetical predicted protein [Marmota monax]|uniref:3-beta hydroxysteroid dehydrogenase/isomerase domain-containing protein n=1 Tax=Marmota monax TaxID=9995 RepID=A0A5E4CAM1_MARMO|nr:hypothetical protein GHT09_003403 [Marmota monax]VTJ78883.1 Hypothetical predicted protein [Marmota monax]
MKPNPTGSFPETCKAAGQGEKTCPVCQARGGVSGPGPGVGSGSGLGAGPSAVVGPGPGPGVVLGPGPRAGAAQGPSVVPGPGPGAGAVLRPGPGTGSGPGPGAASSPGTGPRRGSTTPAPAPQPKTQSKPTQAPRQKVLVTGGGGYLGFSLGSSLAKSGPSVILLDLRRPQWELPPRTEFIQVQGRGSRGTCDGGGGNTVCCETRADVRDEEALHRALEGVDCVFHVASYGMSGAERHIDHYSRTKAIADQLTLMANGTPLPGGGILRTCVLRPPGIYGPEERRHLPRVASHIKRRLLMFRFGDRRTRMNWVHVRNLVQAHVLAAEALTAAKGYVASGQAYYINDGESVNLFEWMAPLVGIKHHPLPG